MPEQDEFSPETILYGRLPARPETHSSAHSTVDNLTVFQRIVLHVLATTPQPSTVPALLSAVYGKETAVLPDAARSAREALDVLIELQLIELDWSLTYLGRLTEARLQRAVDAREHIS